MKTNMLRYVTICVYHIFLFAVLPFCYSQIKIYIVCWINQQNLPGHGSSIVSTCYFHGNVASFFHWDIKNGGMQSFSTIATNGNTPNQLWKQYFIFFIFLSCLWIFKNNESYVVFLNFFILKNLFCTGVFTLMNNKERALNKTFCDNKENCQPRCQKRTRWRISKIILIML